MNLISQVFGSFVACVAFAIIYRAPIEELFYCGVTGACGWFLYTLINYPSNNAVMATFIAAMMVTATSRFLSHIRRAPSTLYLIPGIIPLVPGAGLYYTMYSFLSNDIYNSYLQGVTTLKLAGVISLGIILVLSLPYSAFNFIKLKD